MSEEGEGFSLKIDSHFRSISKLEKYLEMKEKEVDYYLRVNDFGRRLIQESKSGFKKSSSTLMTEQMRLSSLEKQAVLWKKNKNMDSNEAIGNSGCDISQHLKRLLKQTSASNTRIEELKKRKQEAYSKINAKVEKDEPYIHAKIMGKIQREVKRQAKIQCIKQLEAIVKQKRGWLQENKAKIDSQIAQKEVEHKIAENLERMKEIMNSTIVANEYYRRLARDTKMVAKNSSRIMSTVQTIRGKVKESIKRIGQADLQSQLDQFELQKNRREKEIIFSEMEVSSVNEVMAEARARLNQPLSTQNSAALLQEAERINQMMARLGGKKNP